MKNLIFYKTNTGFTKKYVDLLEKRIDIDKVFELKEINKKVVKEAKNLIYMGPLKNNVIEGLDKFLKFYEYMKDKNVFIIADGIEPITNGKREKVIYANALQEYHVRLYLVPGGIDLSLIKGIKKIALNAGLKFAMKDKPELAFIKDQRVDLVDTRHLDKMVDVFKKCDVIEVKEAE